MVIIERRYEYYAREGKQWTSWFKYGSAKTKTEAKAMIKNFKEPMKKLKGEYRIKEESET